MTLPESATEMPFLIPAVAVNKEKVAGPPSVFRCSSLQTDRIGQLLSRRPWNNSYGSITTFYVFTVFVGGLSAFGLIAVQVSIL